MEELGVYRKNVLCGKLAGEQRGLYTKFSLRCVTGERAILYSLVLEGERGSILLGIPEWDGAEYFFQRTIADRTWNTIGKPLRAILLVRDEEKTEEMEWHILSHTETFFSALLPELERRETCWWKENREGRYLAVPIQYGEAFPIARYFCFAFVRRLFGKTCAVFFFDQRGQPQFRG